MRVYKYLVFERHPEKEDVLLCEAYGPVAADLIVSALQKTLDNPAGKGIFICHEQDEVDVPDDYPATCIHTKAREGTYRYLAVREQTLSTCKFNVASYEECNHYE